MRARLIVRKDMNYRELMSVFDLRDRDENVARVLTNKGDSGDFMLKLGRSKPSQSKLKLSTYLGPALSPPQPSVDWTLAISSDYGMMLNDQLGCCVAAGLAHAVQIITANGDGMITPSDMSILQMYEDISGYNPNDPSTDQGAMETTGMRYMVDHGLAGVKADAFVDVDYKNAVQFKQSISLMGGNYIGVEITQQDMDDFRAGKPWTSTSKDNILGGHALFVPAYDVNGITVITWGKAQPASWDWFHSKVDESHVLLFYPWVNNSVDCSPDGLGLAQLEQDIKAL